MRVTVDMRVRHHQPAGIGLYATRLFAALTEVDRTSTFIEVRDRRDRSPAPGSPNAEVLRVVTPAHHRCERTLLPWEVRRAHADIHHWTDFVTPPGLRSPSVVTIHDLAFLRRPDLLAPASLAYYRQTEEAAHRAAAVIAVSTATADDVIGSLGVAPELVHVVPLAADPAFAPIDGGPALEAARARLGLPKRFVVFVGTLEPRKDLPTLVRALAGLPRDVSLVLAGPEGWLPADLDRAIAETGTQDRIVRTGRLSTADLVATMNLADVFVLPSLDEGFGMPVVEAMACGTPVVCTDAGALPEVTGDAALRVPTGDPVALAAAVERVLEDRGLAERLRAEGSARAATFSWERTARGTVEVYRAVARER